MRGVKECVWFLVEALLSAEIVAGFTFSYVMQYSHDAVQASYFAREGALGAGTFS